MRAETAAYIPVEEQHAGRCNPAQWTWNPCQKPRRANRRGYVYEIRDSNKQPSILIGCLDEKGSRIGASDNVIKLIRIFFQNSVKSLLKLKVEPKEIDNLKIITGEFIRWIAK